MKKSKQQTNDEQIERLRFNVQRAFLLRREYEQDYTDFTKKQDALTPSELKNETSLFFNKWSFLPLPWPFIKAMKKRGDVLGWVYEPWKHLLTRRLYSPVHLDETIDQDTQGNPVFLRTQDERGFFRFWIDPNAKRGLIHRVLDNILDHLQNTKPTGSNKSKRFRAEKINALAVWESRRNTRNSFPQIARDFNITESTAKKRFYKAYEILYVKRYNPAEYERPEIKKEYLKRECSSCDKRPRCKDLCPDVIAFVEQDEKLSQRELLVKDADKRIKTTRKAPPITL